MSILTFATSWRSTRVWFDWLDCPDLAQSEAVDHLLINMEDLSVPSFDARHKPSGCTTTANDNSLAMAQASVAAMVTANAAPPPDSTTPVLGSSKVRPIDLDTNNLASMVDTVYNSSESSSDSSSASDSSTSLNDLPVEDSEEDNLDSAHLAPPNDMETELSEEDPDPVMEDATMPDSTTIPLLSVGDQQQTLGTGPPTALPMEPSTLGPASADLGGRA